MTYFIVEGIIYVLGILFYPVSELKMISLNIQVTKG